MSSKFKSKTKYKTSGHGSTTKAGKVRTQTPKIPKTKLNKSKCPRVNNRRKYEKRELLKRIFGQNWVK